MLTMCDSGDAGNLARAYTGGGLNDWSLASQDELNAPYSSTGRNANGGFADSVYWSSSQDAQTTAWDQWFPSGNQNNDSKTFKSGVRPVRPF